MTERINRRRVDVIIAWQLSRENTPSNELWFNKQKSLLVDARSDNWTIYLEYGDELSALEGASRDLENVLNENSTLATDLVDAHQAVEANRFRGSRKDDFNDKLEVLQGRTRTLKTNVTNNKEGRLANRISEVEGIRQEIIELRENQQNDITFLERRLSAMRQITS